MFSFFAGIFGYLLSFLYSIFSNYGLAIILFSIIIKLLLLPLSIKQQKTMRQSAKMQEKMKVIQFKYKNDQEKMNQEIMQLYKTEKMSPFSGCIIAIIQMILLLSVFYLVRTPLTYMQKMSKDDINKYVTQLQEGEKAVSKVYPEIDLIREYQWLKEKNPDDENIEKMNIQMNFLGLDLSKIPQQNMSDYTVYIIPILYIMSSFISIRMTTAMQQKQNEQSKKEAQDVVIQENGEECTDLVKKEEKNEVDTVMQTNKTMSWLMPIMSISIAFVAPLGLALYWLVNNILIIVERIVLDRLIKPEAKGE